MAKDLNKILSEDLNLPENVREQINEAWESKLAEAKEELSADLREEFAKKYEHDRGVLAEAADKFLTDKIRAELEEFAQDKRKVVEERLAYKQKIKERTELLDKFITERVAKEIVELREDRKQSQEKFKKLENFVLKQLAEEIQEFHKDKRELVEQKVRMVTEGKKYLNETRKEFIKRASELIEENVDRVLRKEIEQFKDDIKAARENEFGRRVFEAFVGEFMSSYLSEGTEVKKLSRVIQEKEQELESIKEAVAEKEQLAESLQAKLNATVDRMKRNKVLAELLSPLAKDKRVVMKDLLESVQTKDLEKAFNKYLPAVLNETTIARKKSGKKPLNESKKLSEKTGNRAGTNALQESADELDEIKILAGLK